MTLRPSSLASALLIWAASLSIWVGRGIDLGPVNLQAFDLVAVLLAGSWFVRRVGTRTWGARPQDPVVRILHGAFLLALVGIVGVGVASILVAETYWPVLRFLVRYLIGIVTILALSDLLSSRSRVRTLILAVTVGAVASIVIGGAGFVIPALGEITLRSSDRVQAFTSHPNQLAILLTSWIPVTLAVAFRRPLRGHAWLPTAVLIAGVGLTGSKFNLLLLAVIVPTFALGFIALHRDWTRRLLLRLVFAGVAAAVGTLTIAVVAWTNPRTLATFERLADDPFATSTVTSRQELWSIAIRTGNRSPLLGIGADHADTVLPYDHAHNVVLNFYLSLGVAGVAALMLLFCVVATLFVVTVRTVRRTRHTIDVGPRALALGCSVIPITYIAGNMSSDSFGPSTVPLLWIAIATSLASLDALRVDARRGAAGSP